MSGKRGRPPGSRMTLDEYRAKHAALLAVATSSSASFDVIGRQFGRGGEAVRAICKRAQIERPPTISTRSAAKRAKLAATAEAAAARRDHRMRVMLAMFRAYEQKLTLPEVAVLFEVSVSTVQENIQRAREYFGIGRRTLGGRPKNDPEAERP